MGRFQIKKHDTHIDMTPMSDVMVLLLTFFMLTSTFVKREPVKVNTPGSVSEIKVPDLNVLTILIEPTGRIFLTFDKKTDFQVTLDDICLKYGIQLTPQQKGEFADLPLFGVPLEQLPALAAVPEKDREAVMLNESNRGIPCEASDSTDESGVGNQQFKDWVLAAKDVNPDLRISIKADATTPYSVIKEVMNALQDIKENRYNLITSLKKEATE